MSDPNAVALVEAHVAEAYAAERHVPGVEVHQDEDATWVVHCGSAWRNSAILLRFSDASAAPRVRDIVARYARHGRGAGFWVTDLSTPRNLTALLRARGLRCRKHFPAMIRRLAALPARDAVAPLVEIQRLDAEMAARAVASTARGRCEVERLRVRLADPESPTRVFIALHKGQEVGRIELFIGSRCSGIHGLGVHESHQGRGIGSALLDYACQEAAAAGSPSVVLLATSEGQRLYEHRGFQELARVGYWYRSFQSRRLAIG